ncbi:MAG: TetR/AcrR family transcriptional regulator [Kofleriaceae bacterium]
MPGRPPRATSRRRRAAAPRRRVRLELDARRAQLLAIGRAIFSERAYDDVSVDELARAAGISKGLLYHYFPTKRDLYVAGLRATAAELIDRTGAIDRTQPPIDRVRAGLDAFLDHVSAHAPGFIALMRGGVGSDPEIAEIIADTRAQLIERMLRDAGATPLGAVAHRPIFRIALRSWIGAVEAASIDWLATRDCPRTDLRELLVALLIATLTAAGAPATSWR